MRKNANGAVGERLEGQPSGFFALPMVKYIRKNWILYLFVLPTILWYILFRYLPMPGVYMAFTKYKGFGSIFDAKFVGMKWFESFFRSDYAKQTLINTIRLSLYSLCLFPLPIVFAVIANEIRHEKFKKVTQTIVYAPHFVSLVIMVTAAGYTMDGGASLRSCFAIITDGISSTAFPNCFGFAGTAAIRR